MYRHATRACRVLKPRRSHRRRQRRDSPFDQMQATRSIHNTTDLAGLQGEGRLLEFLLHISSAEVAKIATLARTAAIRLGQGQLAQGDLAVLNPALVALDDVPRILLAASDFRLCRCKLCVDRRRRCWACPSSSLFPPLARPSSRLRRRAAANIWRCLKPLPTARTTLRASETDRFDSPPSNS